MAQLPGADVGARPDPTAVCHVGVYRLDDGSWVDLAPNVDTGLRWRRLDGSTSRMIQNADGRWVSTLGWTDRVEGPQPQLGTCAEDRIAFRYSQNPNGAMDAIAGVLSANRRVLGMMPHPERAVDMGHGGTDGQALFRGLVGQLAQA